MTTSNITAQDIANRLNTTGYAYFGEKARAYNDRIYFGRDFVRYEAGQLSNNKAGHVRALTIGWAAVEACEKALAEIAAAQ